MITDKPFTFDRVIRIAITLVILYGIFLLLSSLQSVLVPFAVAALLAYWMNPLVKWVQRKLKIRKRLPAILLSLLFVTIVLVGISLIVVPIFTKEVVHMGRMLGDLAQEPQIKERINEYLPENISEYVAELTQRSELQELFQKEKFQESLIEAGKKVIPGVWGVFSGALNFVLGIIGLTLIILYLIFILFDYDKIMVGWKELIPSKYKGIIVDGVDDFKSAMGTYFRAQASIAGIVGILFAIGFAIIGLPLGVLFGLLVGVFNLVPYLQNVAFVPAAFLALIHTLETGGNFWWMMGLVLLVFVVVQAIQDAVLTPKIMGDATGLNPAAMLLSLSIWGKLLGFLGLIIALPLTFLLLSYWKRLVVQNQLPSTSGSESPPNK